jgi:hypothetical protein
MRAIMLNLKDDDMDFSLFVPPDQMECLKLIGIAKDEGQVDQEELNNFFNYLRKEFNSIFYTGEVLQSDQNGNFVVEYTFLVKDEGLLKQFSKLHNQLFNNLKKMESDMAQARAPYKLWTIQALMNECKQRQFNPKDYQSVKDKNILVQLLEQNDQNKKKSAPTTTTAAAAPAAQKPAAKAPAKPAATKAPAKPKPAPVEEPVVEEEVFEEVAEEEQPIEETEETFEEFAEETTEEEQPIEEEQPAEETEEVFEEVEAPAPAPVKPSKPAQKPAAKPKAGKPAAEAEAPKEKKVTAVSSLMEQIKDKGLWVKGCQFLSNDEKQRLLDAKTEKERKVIYAIVEKKLASTKAILSEKMKGVVHNKKKTEEAVEGVVEAVEEITEEVAEETAQPVAPAKPAPKPAPKPAAKPVAQKPTAQAPAKPSGVKPAAKPVAQAPAKPAAPKAPATAPKAPAKAVK